MASDYFVQCLSDSGYKHIGRYIVKHDSTLIYSVSERFGVHGSVWDFVVEWATRSTHKTVYIGFVNREDYFLMGMLYAAISND